MRRVIVLIAVLLLALASVTTASAAQKETATDTFHGYSDLPSINGSLPAEIETNPANWDYTGWPDAIGLPYTYTATGHASGNLPGDFTYEEKGIAYLTNPADPSTVVGNKYVSGVFTLTPNRPGPKITIADTNTPRDSNFGGGLTSPSELLPHGAMGAFAKIINQKTGVSPKGGHLAYGYFTFDYQGKTLTGYATPDFTEFAIDITFDR